MSLVVTWSLVFALSAAPNHHWLVTAALFHSAIGIAVLLRWRRQRARGWLAKGTSADIKACIIEAGAISLGWFLFLSIAALEGAVGDQALIATMMAGVMAVGASRYSALPAASLAFLVCGVLVSTVYSVISSIPTSVYVFLAIFVVMLGRSVLSQARMFTEQFRLGLELAEVNAERDLLNAKTSEQEWRDQARCIAEAAKADKVAEEARRTEMLAVAEKFESTILATITQLAAASDQACNAAATLSLTTLNAHYQVGSVASSVGEADTGANTLLEACHQLATSVSRVKEQMNQARR
jgi:methyl-accepting chemotaxis protein